MRLCLIARSCAVAFVLCLCAVPPASASHPKVDAARAAYDRGEMSIALALLNEAERDAAVGGDDLVQLYWYKAACFHAKGNAAEVAAAFDKLLKVQPLFEPSVVDASPELYKAF